MSGYKTALGGYHAFRWQAGSFVDLGVLAGFAHSFGWAINAVGDVAGNSTSASGNSEQLFRYTTSWSPESRRHGRAQRGSRHQLLGPRGRRYGQFPKRALLYTDADGLQDLNTLIDPSLGWVLLAANDINDAEQIVGYGFNNFTGQTHAVRLEPAAGPPPQPHPSAPSTA